jgi:hypothetical protein
MDGHHVSPIVDCLQRGFHWAVIQIQVQQRGQVRKLTRQRYYEGVF